MKVTISDYQEGNELMKYAVTDTDGELYELFDSYEEALAYCKNNSYTSEYMPN